MRQCREVFQKGDGSHTGYRRGTPQPPPGAIVRQHGVPAAWLVLQLGSAKPVAANIDNCLDVSADPHAGHASGSSLRENGRIVSN
jgi:hypothetical protein